MKKILLLCITIYSNISYSQNTIPQKIDSNKKVGWIAFDNKIDNNFFFLCDEKNIMEYYQVGTLYKEGLKSIKNYFKPYYEVLNKYFDLDGYFTIRFVVNCKGEIDRFRFLFVDDDYQNKSVKLELKNKMIEIMNKMEQWTPGEYKDKKYDSYVFITFKIKNNEIVDLLP